MRLVEIEMWANRVLNSIDKSGLAEDHRVELKREWIRSNDAARRIAAHANSAPDDTILWLIGIDEKTGKASGIQPEDLADWWPKVEAEFAERIAPEPTAINMLRDGVPFVAIAFKTDRAPYLVHNESFGKLKGQNMAWEVPFRIGTETRTATRAQLLGLISPALYLPKVELISAGVALNKPVREERWVQKCIADAQFYLIMPTDETITLDTRACGLTIEVEGLMPSLLAGLSLSALGSNPLPPTSYTCIVTGPKLLHIHAEDNVPSIGTHTEQLHLTVDLRPIGFERKISLTCTLNRQSSNPISGVTHSFVAQGLLAR